MSEFALNHGVRPAFPAEIPMAITAINSALRLTDRGEFRFSSRIESAAVGAHSVGFPRDLASISHLESLTAAAAESGIDSGWFLVSPRKDLETQTIEVDEHTSCFALNFQQLAIWLNRFDRYSLEKSDDLPECVKTVALSTLASYGVSTATVSSDGSFACFSEDGELEAVGGTNKFISTYRTSFVELEKTLRDFIQFEDETYSFRDGETDDPSYQRSHGYSEVRAVKCVRMA